MRSLITQVVRMVQEGWRPYNAQPRPDVYERLDCPHMGTRSRQRPYWFVRGDIFCCIGCERACALNRPSGFPAPLPINYPSCHTEPFTLAPQELVRRRHTLNVRETAYCLNISERKVYKMVAEGELTPLREHPVRIRATDVWEKMEDFDE